MRPNPSIPLAWALFAVIAPPALADRPLLTETADVIDPGVCQVEAAGGHARRSSAPSIDDVAATVSCGVPFASQLGLGVAQARSEGRDVQGVAIGGKTNLRPPDDGQIGFGVAYSIAGVKDEGAAFKGDTVSLIGLLTVEVAPRVLGHVNLGIRHSQEDRLQRTVWSLGLETVGTLTFAADLFGNSRDGGFLSAGVGQELGHGWSLNATYALQFDAPRLRQFAIGTKFVF